MKGNRHESQMKAIEKDLKAGRKISPLQALRDYGCLRLSARIYDLKHKRHLDIAVKMKHEGELKWAEYKLVK